MMTLTPAIQDAPQRERALTPGQSFIVQAPAGSGKTELLTQRFLMLLGYVNVPEEILAITFTKKAAAEMRARIVKMLLSAHTNPEPTTAHAKKTWQLARKALQQDQRLGWNLLTNPNRLRIQTIDSFNASLTRQLPMLAHFGAPPEITEDAEPLYIEAVEEFLSHLEENVAWSDAIACLLTHRNNDLEKVQKLLVTMLSKRDQWLPLLGRANLRQDLEDELTAIVLEILTSLTQSFPVEQSAELLTLARFAGDNLSRNETSKNIHILHCKNLLTIPGDSLADLPVWLGLLELLFTQDTSWRKKYDISVGFPPESAAASKPEKILYKEMKNRMLALTESLQSHQALTTAFFDLKHAPATHYDEEQWQVLNTLYQILQVVAAQLKVTFRLHGKIDYIENALAASIALGTEETPTDLALALDYQIKHILIDEFQDTSNSQYRLLEKLIAGWENGDGRTLFIVGDPMQSIYRFREADVANFIRARINGIDKIKLEPLTLAVNFRSTPIVVDWINRAFQKILAPTENIHTGAITYSNSIANETHCDNLSIVRTHATSNSNQTNQAQNIVALITQLRAENPAGSIAILVRARLHLKQLIPALKNAGLIYSAIKIDKLNDRPAIQDLMALTRALLNPVDRIAWLAILRAPWCGLTLNDLLIIANSQPGNTLLENLLQPTVTNQLSTDGQQRLARVLPILTQKTIERKRYELSSWVENTWLLLGGPACLHELSVIEDITAYFNLLKQIDLGGDLLNLDELDKQVKNLHAAPNTNATNSLQIMTIHQAKGLEFDTVILPFLERPPTNDQNQLLHWLEIPREHAPNRLVLAPLHATGTKSNSIYNYVKKQLNIKNAHETSRLLYVATTRAKQQLHLFLNPAMNNTAPDEDENKLKVESLFKKLYPAIAHELKAAMPETNIPATIDSQLLPNKKFISRLSTRWNNPITAPGNTTIYKHQTLPGLQLARDNARHIGIMVHLILQQISRLGISWWQTANETQRNTYIKNHLLQLGILAIELKTAITTVNQAIHNTLQDKRGLWILHQHNQQQAELALTAVIDGEIEKLILDRTFIDETGKRWIIDYKTEFFAGGDLESFLQTEQTKHSDKMLKYQAAMREMSENPIHLGLYFPLISAWKEWIT